MAAAGGNNSSTRLYLRFEGDEDSVAVQDEAVGASGALAITALGSARLRRGVTSRGQSALYLDGGVGSYVAVTPRRDFNLSTDAFTLDFWANALDAGAEHLFSFTWGTPELDQTWFALERVSTIGSTTRFRLRHRVTGVDRFVLDSPTAAHVAVHGALTHFAIVRSANTVKLYIGGAEYGSAEAVDAFGSPLSFNLGAYTLNIGRSFQSASPSPLTMRGYFDDLRLQMSAQWTAPFTPESASWAPTFTNRAVGRHSARAGYSSKAVGMHAIGVRTFTNLAIGQHVVRTAATQHAIGKHSVRTPTSSQAVGAHAVVVRSFSNLAVGMHTVREAMSNRAVGQHQVITTTFSNRAIGVAIVRAGFSNPARGVHVVRNAVSVVALGEYAIENTTLDRYEIYHAIGGMPDFTAAPFATSATLPVNIPALTGAGVHHVVVRKRNRFGLISRNVAAFEFELNGAGALLKPVPRDPEAIDADVSGTNKAIIRAEYLYGLDGDDQADNWKVYARDGTFVAVTEPDLKATVPMVKVDGIATLAYEHQFGASQGRIGVAALRSFDGRQTAILGTGFVVDMTVIVISGTETISFVRR